MSEVFNIENFNVISDDENYYFFRSLEDGDVRDLEEGKIVIDENGKFTKLRTDRERYNEQHDERAKYTEESTISLEEMYDHIKMHYSLQTNCISLSSNANVARTYEKMFSDNFVMIRVPKKDMDEKCFHAGPYMLSEIEKRVNAVIKKENLEDEILDNLKLIDTAKDSNELKDFIKRRYTSKEKVDPSKAKMKDGIVYRSPHARISSWQSLNEEQALEKNKIIAKLTVLEQRKIMKPIIPHSSNNNFLIQTIGNAFSSGEQIYYGDIPGETVLSVSKEIIDILGLIQQVNGIDNKKVDNLKKEIISFINGGNKVESIDYNFNKVAKNDISIEEMYELTKGRVEYGKANSIIKNMFYLSRAQNNARTLADVLKNITKNNSEYIEIIDYIRKNGYTVENEITTKLSNRGVQLSESVSLDFKKEEEQLINEIKKLSNEEQLEIINAGGLSNTKDLITKCFSNISENEQIEKSKYYAEAIISQYNWQNIGIEEFRLSERNELIKRLQGKNCIEIYNKLKEKNISEKEIPTILLNIALREGFYEEYINGNLESLLEERQDILKAEINIELVEKFLGYYDVENTKLKLKPYQKETVENTDEILKDNKFATVILPTGGGKSFVAMDQLLKHQDEEMLYLAPQNEILEQTKNNIIKYIHGPQNTIGKTKDEIIADVFPNLKFSTYPRLLAREGKEIIDKKYGFVVLDELHRTGADKWEEKLDNLLENQDEDTKVLGITATPRRDVDGINMSNKIAEKLGYTNQEAVSGKHIAMNLSLTNAIRMGLVVNPKLVSCAYSLKTDGSLDSLKEKINSIEDANDRNKKLEKYEQLRRNLDESDGISKIMQSNIKKGGKYIVFLPIVDEIEDEDGNVIGRKKGKDKLADYEKQIRDYFKDSDIKPNFHSMLGEYGDKENEKNLEEFQNRDTEDAEFMLVINKANEGLHLDKLDGIIWLRALDENSRILYLQQLGRVISSEDKDNPSKDEDRPIVLDLVNNTIKVNWENEITEQDDIEMLTLIANWTQKHNGMIPNINSTDREESGYAKVLEDIQSKYKEYLDGDYKNKNEKQIDEINKILRLGEKIDLWQITLLEKEGNGGNETSNGSKDNKFGPFEITGILRDFIEQEDDIENDKKTPFEEIMKFCESEGRFPRGISKKASERTEEEKNECSLYFKWHRTDERKIVDEYVGKNIEEIPEEDRELVEKIRGFGYGLTTFDEVMKFCESEGRFPRAINKKAAEMTEEEKNEYSLYKKWLKTDEKKIVDEYVGKNIEEIPKEDRELVKKIRKFGYGLTAFEEVIKFCESEGRIPRAINKKAAEMTEEEKNEYSLYQKWLKTDEKKIVDKYVGKNIKEIPKEDRELVEKIRDFGYGLTAFEEVMKFCESEGRIPRAISKKASERTEEEKNEFSLYRKWLKSDKRKIVDKYVGKNIEEIPEEDRELVEKIRDFGYGLGNGLTPFKEVMKFCESKGRIPRSIRKKVEEMTEDEKNEVGLYYKWIKSDEKKIVDKYVGKNIEEIPEEDRELVEKIRDFGYGLGNGLTPFEEVIRFCESKGRFPKAISKKAAERTEEEKNEFSLYRKWIKSDEKKIVDEYVGKNIEEIPEEYRELAEKIRGFGYIEKEKKDTAHIENKMIKNEKEEVIEHIIELQREDKALTNQIAIEKSKSTQVKI